MSTISTAMVHLDDGHGPRGTPIGAVAHTDQGIVFEYAPAYRGPSISPVLLPTDRPGQRFTFPELRRMPAFQGLPGVLADSLPDRFGSRLIEAYFRDKGIAPKELSPVQKLLYIGRRGMGALTYHPAHEVDTDAQHEAVDLARLRRQAQLVLQGKASSVLSKVIAEAASSAGGARAKALVFWNKETDEMAVGHDTPPGYVPWLVKFDGTDEDSQPMPWTRTERAYGLMAAEAGLIVPESHLFEDGPYRHFGVQRFDRTPDGRRVHYHSLAGLQHADHNDRQLIGYELLLQSCLDLHLGVPALNEAFRRMVFNVVARNQDDHTKNIGFLMDPETSRWTLAPAFDLCYSADSEWTAEHQMTINGKGHGFAPSDLLAVANAYDVERPKEIIEQVTEAVANWPRFADQVDVPREHADFIATRHRLNLTVPKSSHSPGPRR